MIDKKTLEWVKKVQASGFSDEKIKSELKNNGWSDEQISEILESSSENGIINFKKSKYSRIYSSKGKKIGDFFLGFLGASAFFYGVMFLFPSFDRNLSLLIIIISIIILLVSTIFFKKIERSYINSGIISAIILPIILFGSCVALINSY